MMGDLYTFRLFELILVKIPLFDVHSHAVNRRFPTFVSQLIEGYPIVVYQPRAILLHHNCPGRNTNSSGKLIDHFASFLVDLSPV